MGEEEIKRVFPLLASGETPREDKYNSNEKQTCSKVVVDQRGRKSHELRRTTIPI